MLILSKTFYNDNLSCKQLGLQPGVFGNMLFLFTNSASGDEHDRSIFPAPTQM